MRQFVYDLPTRLFHWLFAALFLTAFVIAKTIDDDNPVFSYHMLAGLTLSFVILLRIIWGFVGSKHARFWNFALNPVDLFSYLRGIFAGDKRRWAGHNPASSWAGIIMMALALGSGITGYLMATGNKEAFEDLHELFANTLIITVILHVLGIVIHTIRHREMIGLSMLDGKKADVPPEDVISSQRFVTGVFFVALVLAFAANLFKNYDAQARTLGLFGTTLQLGENDEGGENSGEGGESNLEDDED